jgi:pimeloyl-ACP methyl ester carboxylesterase
VALFAGCVHIRFSHSWSSVISNPLAEPPFLHSSMVTVLPLLLLAANVITVIAPDLRGLGDSSKPLTGYDGKTVAEDIHQLVTQLGFKTIFLVGHDIGALIAYPYAAAHPTELKRLAVWEAPIPGFAPPGREAIPRWGSGTGF